MDVATDPSLTLLGIVLLVGLFVPALLQRFRIPFVSTLILLGALLGPYGTGLVEADDSLRIFAFLGATFHMLLAGFEATDLDLRLNAKENALVFLLGGLVPGAVGTALGFYLGYSWAGAILAGAIFTSSSVMLVFSFVRHFELRGEVAARLKSGAVLQDFAGALIAFVLLQSVSPHDRFSLPILLGLVLCAVAALRMFVPEVVAFAFSRLEPEGTPSIERRVRFVLALMLLVLFLFAALDVPPIIAAFMIGLALAPIDESEPLRERLHLIGYALFIPVFMFVVGLDTDVGLLSRDAGWGVALLTVGAVLSKSVGGFVSGRLIGLTPKDSAVLGVGSSVKLSVPLSTTYVALNAGIIGADLYAAVVMLSVITSLVLPLVLDYLLRTRETHGLA